MAGQQDVEFEPNEIDNGGAVANYTTDFDAHEIDARFYMILWMYITPIMLTLIFILGTVGNTLVIIVILSKNSMRTTTNFLLLNLAIADIILLVVCIPFTAYRFYAFNWPFGDIMCKIVRYAQYVSVYTTVYTLVAISILRYMTVVWSVETQKYRTRTNVVLFMVLLWVVMLSINIPVMLSHTAKYIGFTYCGMVDGTVKPVFISFAVAAYAVPLTIICLTYLLILHHLRRQKSSMLEKSGSRDRTAHAFRVIIVVIVVFALSWLPHHINSLLSAYEYNPAANKWYEVFRLLMYCMEYSNSCVNPLIYNYCSQEFRKSFREAVHCGCRTQAAGSRRFRSSSPENGTIAETTAMV